ncbi:MULTISPECIES: hypothetical protein [Kamptonema]|uniref:hypothetical protein n=1 Tax=Kamptonema TaxID=1501433 RepID=UPI0001DAC933|nr:MULTISPECIES: hypothetical protein [Kamptonema]CBN54428.1 conserved hypothetical protein [Kamptonema sp. PCC 6506]
MTNEVKIPDEEARARSVEKMRSLCKRIDSNFLELDELIASLEADIRNSPLIAYRLGKIKKESVNG